MQATITKELQQDDIREILLTHPNGLKIRLTAGPLGFHISSSQQIVFSRYNAMSGELRKVQESDLKNA